MTARTLFTVAAFAVLSGWVSGQGPTARRTADEEAELLKANRLLLENLLDDGLKVSEAETVLDRATTCRRAVDRLAAELSLAASLERTDRVSEIGDHLTALLNDGFLPTFGTARDTIRPGSMDFDRFRALHRESASQLGAAVDALPTTGKFATDARVKALRDQLAAIAEQVGKPTE